MISVGDKVDGSIFFTSVSNVAAIRNLYLLNDRNIDPNLLEIKWAEYEGFLKIAINDLLNRNLDAKKWIRILVPFVACLLVRGPDFDKRFTNRLHELGITSKEKLLCIDNTNLARLFELQRLLGPIAIAKWTLVKTNGSENLITNDLGYGLFYNPPTNDYGIAIPIGLRHILTITPRFSGTIATVVDGKWVPTIEYVENSPDNHEKLNQAITSIAQRYIFGPENNIIQKYLSLSTSKQLPPEPGEIGFITRRLARAQEFTWHRLAAAFERDPFDGGQWDFSLDWELIGNGWVPPVYFSTNLVEFPSIIHREGNQIIANTYDPEVYYILSEIRQLEFLGEYKLLLERATSGLKEAKEDNHKVSFLVARAAALDELERYDEALNDIDAALQIEPNSVTALINKVGIMAKKGEFDESIKLLDKALLLEPKNGLIRLNRGAIFYYQNLYDDSISEIKSVLSSIPPGPPQGAAHLTMGNAFLELGDIGEAIKEFDLAISSNQEPKAIAYYLVRKAEALSLVGNNDESMQVLEKSIEYSDDLAEAYLLKAELCITKHMYEESIASYTKALNLLDDIQDKSNVLDLRARAYASNDCFDLALQDIERAIEIDKGSSSKIFNKGLILMNSGDYENALIALNEAIILNYRNAGAYNNRGIIYLNTGDIKLAICDFKQSVRFFTKNYEIGSPLRNLALCYSIKGSLDEANKYLKQARELDPKSIHNTIVESRQKLYEGNFIKSHELISELIDDNTELPILRIYLILPLVFLGRVDEAVNIYQGIDENKREILIMHYLSTDLRFLREHYSDNNNLLLFLSLINKY